VIAFRLQIFTVSVFVLWWKQLVCFRLRPRVGLLSVIWKEKRMLVGGITRDRKKLRVPIKTCPDKVERCAL
jgi:dolichol kinase